MISMLGVTVPNNPAPFKSDYEFEITFECLQEEGLEKGVKSYLFTFRSVSRLISVVALIIIAFSLTRH